MGNDIEVKSNKSVHSEVVKLLENELNALAKEDKYKPYNLEEEFSAAEKNKNKFLWKNMFKPLVLCALTVFLLTCGISSWVIYDNSHIDVKVSEFENLNLKSLLNKLSDTESIIQRLVYEKKRLEGKLSLSLEQAELEHDADIQALEFMHLRNRGVYEKRRSEIEEHYAELISEVQPVKEELEKVNAELNKHLAELSSYDSESLKKIESDRSALDSELFLHEKEKNQLTDDYESKLDRSRQELKLSKETDLEKQKDIVEFIVSQYDPEFKPDSKIEGIHKRSSGFAKFYKQKRGLSSQASARFSEAVRAQNGYYSDISALKSVFSLFPQKSSNAIMTLTEDINKIAVHAGTELSAEAVDEVNAWIESNNRLEEKVSELEQQNASLVENQNSLMENLCRSYSGNAYDGFVTSLDGEKAVLYVAELKRPFFTDDIDHYTAILNRAGKKVCTGIIRKTEDVFFFMLPETPDEKKEIRFMHGDSVKLVSAVRKTEAE